MRVLKLIAVFAASTAAAASNEMDSEFSPDNLDLDDIEDDTNEYEERTPAEKVKSAPASKPVPLKTVEFLAPTPANKKHTFLEQTFQDSSDWKKVSSDKFTGVWETTVRDNDWIKGDKALKMTSAASFHALTRELTKEFTNKSVTSIYGTMEVQFEKEHNCGGAYFKLYHTDKADGKVENFDETTPYSIMFGPDRCGFMTNKVHLIVKFPHPSIKGEYVEEHLDSKDAKIPSTQPKGTHQYGFALHADSTCDLWIDGQKVVDKKPMTEVFKTHFENEKMIKDPNDEKPEDWVDDAKIPDPDATKPEDWDEDAPKEIVDEDAVMPDSWKEDAPLMIPNPKAEKPDDWNDEEDGEWIRPKMRNPECTVGCGKWSKPSKPNPDYKGKWVAPKIDNPQYKGPWSPREIDNPNHYEIKNPWSVIAPMNAIGFELWTVEAGAAFDNILITSDETDFLRFIDETYKLKAPIEKANEEALRAKENADAAKEEKADKSTSGLLGLLQSVAGQNNYTLGAALGIPLAAMGYLVNSWMRKKVVGVSPVSSETAGDKKTSGDEKKDASGASPASEQKETEASESTAAASKHETKEVRKRKNSANSNQDK